jgi:hypothetical protein
MDTCRDDLWAVIQGGASVFIGTRVYACRYFDQCVSQRADRAYRDETVYLAHVEHLSSARETVPHAVTEGGR